MRQHHGRSIILKFKHDLYSKTSDFRNRIQHQQIKCSIFLFSTKIKLFGFLNFTVRHITNNLDCLIKLKLVKK